jgi:hypothetical protein
LWNSSAELEHRSLHQSKNAPATGRSWFLGYSQSSFGGELDFPLSLGFSLEAGLSPLSPDLVPDERDCPDGER